MRRPRSAITSVLRPSSTPDRVGDVLCIVLGRDQANTRTPAAPDLVLQARARPVREERVFALAHAKQLLQQQQRFAGGDAARIGPEVPVRAAAWPAVERDPRVLVRRGELDVGKALVVAQLHVVARPVPLDEVRLEQQRLGRRGRDRDLDPRHRARA